MHEQIHRANHASAHFKQRDEGPRVILTIGFGQGRYITSQLRLAQARSVLQVLQRALADADAFFNRAGGTDRDDDSQS